MKRYLTGLNVILITVAVYLSINAFYKAFTAQLDYGVIPRKSSQQNLSRVDYKPKPFSHYSEIIERNLFNTRKIPDQKRNGIKIETLKQTKLNLKLLGTVMGDKEETYAVIEEAKTRKQNLYKTGDTIQNAAIKMILRKKVVLRVNNLDEILVMEEKTAANKARRPRAAPLVEPAQSVTLNYSQIEEAVQDVNQLISQVNIRPYFEKGKAGGLLLTRIKPRSFFRQIGLRSGDIITGLDDRDIQTVDDALEIYERMRSASDVTLHLKRRGRPKTIDYHIEQTQ